jgi:hypothetical protein
MYSGLLSRAVWLKFTDVSEVTAAYIIRVIALKIVIFTLLYSTIKT